MRTASAKRRTTTTTLSETEPTAEEPHPGVSPGLEREPRVLPAVLEAHALVPPAGLQLHRRAACRRAKKSANVTEPQWQAQRKLKQD
jgi:hypothetical protein